MLEATKSEFDTMRERTGITVDGAPPVDAAPPLGKSCWPSTTSPPRTERDEQAGLANLIKGLSGMFRNPDGSYCRSVRKIATDSSVGSPPVRLHPDTTANSVRYLTSGESGFAVPEVREWLQTIWRAELHEFYGRTEAAAGGR